jgi:biotin synthase
MARNSGIARYVLSSEEFAHQVSQLHAAGRRVIMVQTGECGSNPFFDRLLTDLSLATSRYSEITWVFAFGSLDWDKYEALRQLGDHRYLLKIESSSSELYARSKPSDTLESRIEHLHLLQDLGFAVSTGNITGLPGQSTDDLAGDLLFLKSLHIPMVSAAPFVPNDVSGYADQPPADADVTLNFMALLRLLCPTALIPATSALEMVRTDGQYLGLMAGANVVTLHDGTPTCQEEQFVLYRKGRYLPREGLFKTLERAGLEWQSTPLIPLEAG